MLVDLFWTALTKRTQCEVQQVNKSIGTGRQCDLPKLCRNSSSDSLQAQQGERYCVQAAVTGGVQQEGTPWSIPPDCH